MCARVPARGCGIGVAVFLLLLSTGCVSEDYRNFYYMDLRSFPGPVMISEVSPRPSGRQFQAVASQSEETMSSSYSNAYYSYHYYHHESSETTRTIDTQVLSRALPSDRSIYVDEIGLFSHFLGSFGYSESTVIMNVDVIYSKQ
jgi:hypothetical protein